MTNRCAYMGHFRGISAPPAPDGMSLPNGCALLSLPSAYTENILLQPVIPSSIQPDMEGSLARPHRSRRATKGSEDGLPDSLGGYEQAAAAADEGVLLNPLPEFSAASVM